MSKSLISRAMSQIGKRKSPRKAAAARENGKLGGRPPAIHKSITDALSSKFTLTLSPSRGSVVLRCKHAQCKSRWTLLNKEAHAGNILKLLDHAASH